jgi:3-hydroxy acid dehydrogenase / malonic semialdehyde reductase
MLKDKIVLITGASSGIGRSCAESFAKSGAKLILLARRMDRLDELESNIKRDYKIDVLCLKCDVRDLKEVEKVINNLPNEWKEIDILINNAGLSRGLEKIQDGYFEKWEEMIDTNIKGLLYVTRLVLPQMIERKSGLIINIASIAGIQAYVGGNVYSASKCAVRMLSQSMQLDLNGTGVRVTNIDPGMVETEFSMVRFSGDAERAAQVYKGFTPLKPEDVAEVALFCATRPDHVSIHDVLVMAKDQASASMVNKK